MQRTDEEGLFKLNHQTQTTKKNEQKTNSQTCSTAHKSNTPNGR